MQSEELKKINYIVVCVNEFADTTGLSVQEAFRYLYNHKGITFLKEHYEIEHTLSLENAIDDLKIIYYFYCKRFQYRTGCCNESIL